MYQYCAVEVVVFKGLIFQEFCWYMHMQALFVRHVIYFVRILPFVKFKFLKWSSEKDARLGR